MVTDTKFLGVWLEENLNWSSHYNHVVLKIKGNMKMLQNSVSLLSTHAKKTLYYGHIYSHLSYCISTSGPMLQQSQIKKLQKLQNKCIHLVDNTRINLQHKFKKHCILNVEQVIELELAKIGYHLLKGELPRKIIDTIETDSTCQSLKKNHRYSTRQKLIQNMP